MGKSLETYKIIKERNTDLMECYREVAPTCFTQTGAYRRMVNHPAKRYYITAMQAYQRLRGYLRGDEKVWKDVTGPKNHLKKELYDDLLDEVLSLAQHKDHQNKSLMQLCEIAVLRPARKFYITPQVAKHVYWRTKHGEYDESGRYVPKKK